MKRVMIAALALSAVAGCSKTGEGGKDQAKETASAAASAQAVKPPAMPVGRFAGTYLSTWGDTVFTEGDETVSATYPGGTLSCVAKGSVLDCSWTEGGATGKARLTRQPDGKIEGSWGSGDSDQGGGQWSFTPKK